MCVDNQLSLSPFEIVSVKYSEMKSSSYHYTMILLFIRQLVLENPP